MKKFISFGALFASVAIFAFMASAGSAAAETSLTASSTASTTAPIASTGSITLSENTSASGTLSAMDTNTSTLPLTFFVVSSTWNGVLSNFSTASGTFMYTPNANFIGGDSFTFKANNGFFDSNIATESINVTSTIAASTTIPMISSIVSSSTDTTSMISWTTDQPATTEVQYGPTSGYGSSTVRDNNLVTNHGAVISGLMPSTTYHFSVMSGNASGTVVTSSDMTFATMAMMNNASSTSTVSSTPSQSDLQSIENIIQQLEREIQALEQEFNSLFGNGNGIGNIGNNNTSTTPNSSSTWSVGGPWFPSGSASLDPVGNVRAGTSVDLGGRNFGRDESVSVTNNGTLVTTARADDGGNFSTGSLPIASMPGQQTYVFIGLTSGITLSETITVTP